MKDLKNKIRVTTHRTRPLPPDQTKLCIYYRRVDLRLQCIQLIGTACLWLCQ